MTTRVKAAFLLVSLFSLAVQAGFKPPSEKRIAEIAAALTDKPLPVAVAKANPRQIQSAENTLKASVPGFPHQAYLRFSKDGNRSEGENLQFGYLAKMRELAWSESAKPDGRFLGKFDEYVRAFCNWPCWTIAAHDKGLQDYHGQRRIVELFSSSFALQTFEAVSQLQNRLPPATVKLVRDNVESRILKPYLADAVRTDGKLFHWWFFGDNNWNTVCHSQVVQLALEFYSDRRLRAQYVEAAERALDSYFAGFTSDGYCSEGAGYWNYGYGCFVNMAKVVRKATNGKIDFFKHPKAKTVMEYGLKFRLQPGIAPYFADGGGCPSEGLTAVGAEVWPEMRAARNGQLPLRDSFPSGQVWISRLPASDPIRFAVGFKGGHNGEQHNHNDVGSWHLVQDGKTIAGEVGGETYTRRTFSRQRYESKVLNSFGHPVPRVAGQLQPAGRQFAAKVIEEKFGYTMDMVRLDLRGAYPVKNLKKLERTFIFNRAKREFRVRDEVEFTTPSAFDSPVTSFNPDLPVTVNVTGGKWHWENEKIENPGRGTPYRKSVTFDQPIQRATVEFVFAAEMPKKKSSITPLTLKH